MVFQAGYEQTVINRIQLSNCIFQMDYQNQKATMKPNEIFMWCSEQGKFRLRVDILHLACCLTTFHKPTLTFSKWKWKWQKYHSEEPQYKKWTAPFLKDTISMVTLESPDCLTSDQIRSVTQSCPTLCDPMNCSTPGLPVHHQLTEFTHTHIHWVSDAIQPSHPLSSPSPPAHNPSRHQSLFQWVNSSHEMAKVLEFQF